eukprot:6860937-Pyramimonas_sp.AAC.1
MIWRGQTSPASIIMYRSASSSSAVRGKRSKSMGGMRSHPCPARAGMRLAASLTSAPVMGGKGSSSARSRPCRKAS